VMSLYEESGRPLQAACSQGRGPAAPVSHGRVGGIGSGQNGRAISRS
jgi:hypothetical protein